MTPPFLSKLQILLFQKKSQQQSPKLSKPLRPFRTMSAGSTPYDGSDDGYPSFIQNDSYDLNSRIMFCSIVFLTFVILFVFIHHIYTKCTLRQPPPSADPQLTITTLLQVPSQEPPKSGLHPLVIASLPMFVISKSTCVGNVTNECPICLNEFEENEMGRVLPKCGHVFHASCVDMWLVSNSSCPVCRNEVEPESQSSVATSLDVVCM